MFDTLLTRAVGDPQAVFLLLGRWLSRHGALSCSPEGFARARVTAESVARQATPRREVSLDEIYRELACSLELSAEQALSARTAELEIESRLSRPVGATAATVRATAANGGRVIALSDMYLPPRFIEALLAQAGLADAVSRLYVSSELGATKADGGLYPLVIRREGARPSELRHHGDNEFSDVRNARRAGVVAVSEGAASLNRYETALEAHRWETQGLSSVFAGASRLARLAVDADSPHEVSVRDVAAGVAGPTLTAYVLWVLRTAHREGRRRLYFMSRDGQVLWEIARRLGPKLGLDLELRYLYGSRKVFQLAAITEGTLAASDWAYDGMFHASVRDVLKRLDVPVRDALPILERYGLDASSQPHSDEEGERDRIRSLLADPDMEALVIPGAQRARAMLWRYLQQEGLDETEHAAIVDTGWMGRQQRSLAEILASKGVDSPRVFLFGHDSSNSSWHAPDVITAYMYDACTEMGWTEGIPQPWGIIEVFCVGDHGRLLGYRDSDGRIEPDIENADNVDAQEWGLGLFRTTVLAFVEALVLEDDLVDVGADLRGAVVEVCREFWLSPTAAEAQAWGGFVYEDDPVGLSRGVLASAYGLRDIVDGIRRRQVDHERRVWRGGSLQMSGPVTRLAYRVGSDGKKVLRRRLLAPDQTFSRAAGFLRLDVNPAQSAMSISAPPVDGIGVE